MKERVRKDVALFLPIKAIFAYSCIISVVFHTVITLSYCFGASFFSSGKITERHPDTFHQHVVDHEDMPMAGDTAMFADNPHKDFKRFDNDRRTVHFDRVMRFVILSYIMIFLLFVYNRKMMSIGFRRRWMELFFVVLGSLIITAVLSFSFSLLPSLLDQSGRHVFHYRFFRDGLVRDFLLMTIVILISQLLRSSFNQRVIAVENEALRAENINTRYEALKSQMDPHFMFNSLNTLQSLISVDKVKAQDFVQQLSCVLRYTLQNKEVISLGEEMKCVHSYCEMMQIRYGDNLRFVFRIDEKYQSHKVLPLAVQGLVENAIKHNVISAKQPMTVTVVTTDDGVLRVMNPIQPKIMEEKGNGIGLSNLAERYRLMWNKEVLIMNDGSVFEVDLPLEGPNVNV